MGPQQRGFSLIEILIIVALVAILAGMTAPAISGGIAMYSVISSSQQVASAVRSARFQAVGRNTRVRVVFVGESGQYDTEFRDPATGLWVSLDRVETLVDGVSFVAPPASVEFTTEGRLEGGGAAAIVVTNGDNTRDRTVSVTSSGRVQIQ